MSVDIQIYRFDETVPRRRESSVRGRGLDGKGGGNVEAVMYPFDLGIAGLNVRFSFDRVKDGFYSPRHRHNFDQFRYCLSGTVDVGKTASLKEGECGYFPEGTHYGPQDQKGDSEALVMQFPGPEGAYYLVEQDFQEGSSKLRAKGGTFENGVYRGTDENGHPFNQDGFEAVWEAYNGKPVTYAPPRYAEPVIMKPASFKWVADPRRPGLDVKQLGIFNEYRTSLAQWRIAPNAKVPGERLEAPEFRFVLKGEVTCAGKQLSQFGAMFIPSGTEAPALESRGGAEILVISVPMYVPSVWRKAHEAASIATVAEVR